jgi:transposase-like protein
VGPGAATVGAMIATPTCPFCEAGAAERVGHWGGQIITAQWRCQACGSYFEAVREDFDEAAPGQPANPPLTWPT